jgi:MBOAT, membrane-bound O-acyltransferase family
VDILKQCMFVVMRLTSMSICYKDGGQKDLQKIVGDKRPKSLDYYKITTPPTLLEMFSYAFSSSGCVLGPFFEFNDYRAFINLRDNYKVIPLTILPTLYVFAKSLSNHS